MSLYYVTPSVRMSLKPVCLKYCPQKFARDATRQTSHLSRQVHNIPTTPPQLDGLLIFMNPSVSNATSADHVVDGIEQRLIPTVGLSSWHNSMREANLRT